MKKPRLRIQSSLRSRNRQELPSNRPEILPRMGGNHQILPSPKGGEIPFQFMKEGLNRGGNRAPHGPVTRPCEIHTAMSSSLSAKAARPCDSTRPEPFRSLEMLHGRVVHTATACLVSGSLTRPCRSTRPCKASALVGFKS